VSVQKCGGATSAEDSFDRLGFNAFYVFVYPNFMINRFAWLLPFQVQNSKKNYSMILLSLDCFKKKILRYGPWMDTKPGHPFRPQENVKSYLITS
jgi:hypothetical protein